MRSTVTVTLALACMLLVDTARAYEGAIHQQLTFIAARQYNRCAESVESVAGVESAESAPLARLTPLEVRYIAKANANEAERPWWQRLFRWSYYDRNEQSTGRFLWLLETRMHGRYLNTLQRLDKAQDLSRRFTNLGRVANYLQDATTPSYVTPIFTTRWWRFSIADRFNSFPVDIEALDLALGDSCVGVRSADGTFENLLKRTADQTIASIEEPVEGLPTTWEAFWEFDSDNDDFGSYGAAGNNFGRQTTFRCTEDQERDCVLLANDPLYAAYANARHLDAVQATISAVAMMQDHLRRTASLNIPRQPPPASYGE